jgi:hypothetical protein
MKTETDQESESAHVVDAPAALEPPERSVRYAPYASLYLEYRFWANPRSHSGLDDASLGDLAQSIKAGTTSGGTEDDVATYAGILDPLDVVMIKSNGDVINLVIDGQRRHLAVSMAGLPPDTLIPVFDLEPEPVDWTSGLANTYLLRALKKVGTRAGLSSFELSEAAHRLRGSKDPDTGKDFILAKIASAVGRSESWCSKILAARENASAKLLHSWKSGDITDEQFKDLAAVKDQGRQREEATKVVEARKEGDRTGARVLAKEQKIAAQASAPPKPAKEPQGRSPSGKTVREPQTPLPLPATATAPAAKPRKPPSFAVVEDFLSLADKRPPTHDYVRGLMDGARWATGLKDAATFGKPWQAYMRHVQGIRVPKKVPKPHRAPRTAKKPRATKRSKTRQR